MNAVDLSIKDPIFRLWWEEAHRRNHFLNRLQSPKLQGVERDVVWKLAELQEWACAEIAAKLTGEAKKLVESGEWTFGGGQIADERNLRTFEKYERAQALFEREQGLNREAAR